MCWPGADGYIAYIYYKYMIKNNYPYTTVGSAVFHRYKAAGVPVFHTTTSTRQRGSCYNYYSNPYKAVDVAVFL